MRTILPFDSLDVALRNFIDTVSDNISNSIEAWAALHETYENLSKRNGESAVSFTSWCLRKINHGLIQTVSQMKNGDHFNSLSEEHARRISRIASAFERDKWMVYFVLGQGTLDSRKAVDRILRVKRCLGNLTLEVMVQRLETVREQRRDGRSRNSSNDLTRFTLSDVKRAYELPSRYPPAAPTKHKGKRRLENVHILATPIRSRGGPTPPGTDSSNISSDKDEDSVHDVDSCSDVEQPRYRDASLSERSFWANLEEGNTPNGQKGITQHPHHVPPAHSNDGFSDHGGTLMDALDSDSDSDYVEQRGPVTHHPQKPTAEPGTQDSLHCDALSGQRRLNAEGEQHVQQKRQRTTGKPPKATIEISPPMIVEAIISARQLSWLPAIELPPDLQQPDPVDSSVWSLLQECISPPTSNGCAIPMNIVNSMGFPCAEDILKKVDHRNGELSLPYYTWWSSSKDKRSIKCYRISSVPTGSEREICCRIRRCCGASYDVSQTAQGVNSPY